MPLEKDIPENSFDYFPTRFRPIEGSNRRLRRRFLRCSDPVCGREHEITDNGERELPVDVVRKKFRQAGWDVGKNRSHDTCPVCVENARQRSRKPKEVELKQDLKSSAAGAPIRMMIGSEPASPVGRLLMPEETVPKAMSTDDRRVIFGKVDECWAGKDAGYVTPWTDQAIAADLGVPLAWVVDVRSNFFGEVRDNQEIRDILDRATKAAVDAGQLIAKAEAIRGETSELFKRSNALHIEVADLRRSIDGLIAIAQRIERSLK